MSTGIYMGSSCITRITYGTHQSCGCATCTFSYTGSDQHLTIHAGSDVTFDVRGAGSNVSAGGRSTGTKHFDEETELSIMVGGNGGRTNNGTTYGFGGSTTYGGRGGGGLSGVFTGSGVIGDNDSARAIIIAGGAGGGRTGGGAGGGTNGQNGNGGSYGWAGGGASQTAKGSGNQAGGQFHGGGGSGTYGFGGGGGRYGGGGSGGDGSGDDDANAGGGSGYIGRVENGTTTVGGGSGAGTDGSANVTYTYDTIVPTDYVEGYLGDTKFRPNTDVSRLPIEYQELEYIESTGTQYIDTGVTRSICLLPIIEYKFYSTGAAASTDYGLLGFRPSGGNGYILGVSQSQFRFVANSSSGWSSSGVAYSSGRHTFTTDQSYPYIDGNRLSGNAGNMQIGTNTGTIRLMKAGGGWSQQSMTQRAYYFKISDTNGNVIRELIPCYRRKDGVVGMYDIVNNTFYTNAGTGVFNKGPEVNIPQIPDAYQEVKYIGSNAFGPRIDTGITPNQNTVMQFKVMPLGVFGGSIIGAYDNGMSDTQDHRIFNYSSQIYYDLPGGSGSGNRIYGGTFNANTVYEFEAGDWYVKNVGATTNLISGSAINFTGNTTIKLNDNNASYSRWFYVKIFDGNRLVRRMLPCKRKSDNVVGMYDLVSKTFFTNIGSGEFVAGPNSAKVRYIRNYVNGSNVNNACHFVELHAFVGSTNVALNKTVTIAKGSLYSSTPKQPAAFVDGDTNTNNYVDLASYTDGIGGALQVDLGSVYDLDYIVLWHYYSDSRAYKGNVLQVSEDGENRRTVYDSNVSGTYNESSSGRTFYL